MVARTARPAGEPDTVVGDADVDGFRAPTHPHVDARRLRVLLDVRERLLDDAVERQLGIGVDPPPDPGAGQGDLDSGAVRERLAHVAHGRNEAKVVEFAGPEVLGDASHLLHGVLEHGLGLDGALPQPVVGGLDPVGHALQAELGRRQQLIHAVVQLAGDPPALGLLRGQDALGELAHLLLGPLSLRLIPDHGQDARPAVQLDP